MTEELIKELQIILKEEFQVDIDETGVIKYGNSLISYFGTLEEIYKDNLRDKNEE